MTLKTALLFLALNVLSGCMAEIRTSSRAELSLADSQLTLPVSQQESERVISESFAKRGFPIVDRRVLRDSASLLTFKGSRASITTVSGNAYYVGSSTEQIGSVFYARFHPQGEQTQVSFLGKPTVSGKTVCSDQDLEFGVKCDSVSTGYVWTGRQQATGREEAEAIRGLTLELKMAGPNTGLSHAM